MKKLKRFAINLAIGALASMLLAGCGKDGAGTQNDGAGQENHSAGQENYSAGQESAALGGEGTTDSQAPEPSVGEDLSARAEGDVSAENPSLGSEPSETVNPEGVTTVPAEGVETEIFYTTARVRVRKGPSTEAEIYTLLERRTEVARVDDDGEWSRILLDGGIYYVASAYLRQPVEGQNGYVVVIDAGHQKQGNSEKEPIGPGARR